jgi:hypothetical protein
MLNESIDTQVGSRIPGRLRTDHQGSKLAFTRIKGWIKSCDEQHSCAEGHSCASDPKSPPLPARILDTGISPFSTVRLIEPQDIRGHYIAVSHCWGTSDRLKTLSHNINAHKEGINLTDLALTFQHAIAISRELGIRYVWIDSLCIMQDSFDDWEREAPRMGDVYSGAYLTIAAANASDDTEGIFTNGGRRLARSMISCDSIGTGRRCLDWAAPTVLMHKKEIGAREAKYYRQKRILAVCDVEEDPGDEGERDSPRVYCTPEWMPSSLKPRKPTIEGTRADKGEYVRTSYTQTYLVGEIWRQGRSLRERAAEQAWVDAAGAGPLAKDIALWFGKAPVGVSALCYC